MERIRNAIERTKTSSAPGPLASQEVAAPLHGQAQAAQISTDSLHSSEKQFVLNAAHLESKRIVAHDIADQRSKSFDMLRTQLLQSMAMKSWQILGITSATPGCGKSTIATNLALSIARQPGRSVLLVDMDLQKPQIAKLLGLNCKWGIGSVLEGKIDLAGALIQACINDERIVVLPCSSARLNSSEWMSSQAMAALMQQIKRDFRAWTVIIDLPPILMSDDVISILSQIDCMLFVAAAGATTVEEIKDCTKHLESSSVVRVVLNKTLDETETYYSRYGNYHASQASA